MRNYTDVIKFKNGNFNMWLGKNDIATIKEHPDRDMEIILSTLSDNDMYVIGDEFCLSNFDMGCYIYSAYFDKGYIFPFGCVQELLDGKSVKFYALELDEDDRAVVKEQFAD